MGWLDFLEVPNLKLKTGSVGLKWATALDRRQRGGTSGVGDEYLALEVFEQLGAVSE